MKVVNKFGRKIYPKTFSKMQAHARILIKHGYLEAKTKPNLFYKHDDKHKGVIYFADMHGTNMISIWEDPAPLFYVKFNKTGLRYNLMNQLHENEFGRLGICRNSEDYHGYSEGEDGFCAVCDKYFGGDDDYCSVQCKEIEMKRRQENLKRQQEWEIANPPKCEVCGVKNKKLVNHHTDYHNHKIVTVCMSCHIKIHKGNDLYWLKPKDEKPENYQSNSISPKICVNCQKTFRPRNSEQRHCYECIPERKRELESLKEKPLEPPIDWITKTYG